MQDSSTLKQLKRAQLDFSRGLLESTWREQCDHVGRLECMRGTSACLREIIRRDFPSPRESKRVEWATLRGGGFGERRGPDRRDLRKRRVRGLQTTLALCVLNS